MRTKWLKHSWGIVTLSLVSVSADAALLSRLSGLAYYDDVLDITWLANANLAATNHFGVLNIDSGGIMTWTLANEWIAGMNTANYLGQSDWRLPTVTDTGPPGCNDNSYPGWYSGTDCGFNIDPATGEMAHLYFSTLGNTSSYNTSGIRQPCANGPWPSYCFANTGPFSNVQFSHYWSGTEYGPDTSFAWDFDTRFGFQFRSALNTQEAVWAVRSGDIAVVPIPAAAWMFGSALGLLGQLRRKQISWSTRSS